MTLLRRINKETARRINQTFAPYFDRISLGDRLMESGRNVTLQFDLTGKASFTAGDILKQVNPFGVAAIITEVVLHNTTVAAAAGATIAVGIDDLGDTAVTNLSFTAAGAAGVVDDETVFMVYRASQHLEAGATDPAAAPPLAWGATEVLTVSGGTANTTGYVGKLYVTCLVPDAA